jgi:hypothetical protein
LHKRGGIQNPLARANVIETVEEFEAGRSCDCGRDEDLEEAIRNLQVVTADVEEQLRDLVRRRKAKEVSISMSFDYEKLEERMVGPERLVGTRFAYRSLKVYLFRIDKRLELLDFVDREPVMKWLLSQITDKTEEPGIHPDTETVAFTLLRHKAALYWCVSEWILADELGGDYFTVGPILDIKRICSILGLSAHDQAEIMRKSIEAGRR